MSDASTKDLTNFLIYRTELSLSAKAVNHHIKFFYWNSVNGCPQWGTWENPTEPMPPRIHPEAVKILRIPLFFILLFL